MGLLDSVKGLRKKAKNIDGMRKGVVSQGIERAATVIDQKTGGEHSSQIRQAANFIEDAAERIQRD